MTFPSLRALACSLSLLLASVACLSLPISAQDKKKDPDKKTDVKKDDKKVDSKDVKKEDPKKKKDDKKVEIKKEEIKPDLTKEKRDTPLQELKGHTHWIQSLTFSADGKSLLSAGGRDKTVRIWDSSNGKDVLTFKDNPTEVKAAVFITPDRVAGSTGKWNKEKKAWEGEIRIWDRAGKLVQSLKGHSETIECLAVSKDGKFLASGSQDHTIKVWDLAAGKDILTFRAHAGLVHGLAFSPDGTRLASAGADKTVRVWDLTGKEKPIKVEEPKKEVQKEDPKKGKGKKDPPKAEPKEKLDTPLLEFKGPGRDFTCVAFSPDGKRLAAGNYEALVKVYDMEGYKEIAELKTTEGVLSVAFSPDGSKIAAGSWDWAVRVYDVKTGQQLTLIHAHGGTGQGGTVTALAFSPDGKLASGGTDNLIRIWDITKIQRTEKK